MSVLLTVKSENESLKNSFKNYLNDMLIASGYMINEKTPLFRIEVIIEDISSNSVVLSVNYAIYYYLWDYILKNDKIEQLNEIFNESMWDISYKCELDNSYSTGICGIYKHNAYHNMAVLKKYDTENTCAALVSDFNDMVITWKEQTIASTEIMSKMIEKHK